MVELLHLLLLHLDGKSTERLCYIQTSMESLVLFEVGGSQTRVPGPPEVRKPVLDGPQNKTIYTVYIFSFSFIFFKHTDV